MSLKVSSLSKCFTGGYGFGFDLPLESGILTLDITCLAGRCRYTDFCRGARRFQRIAQLVFRCRLQQLPVMCIRLWLLAESLATPSTAYIWQTAVGTPVYLRLVGVDKDLWVTKCTTASIASHNLLVRPSHRLFVNQVDRSHWPWLYT